MKCRTGCWAPALFLVACDHTLVVGEHGTEDAPAYVDAAAEAAVDAPERDVARDPGPEPEAAIDSPVEAAVDSPAEATIETGAPDASDAAADRPGDADAADAADAPDRVPVPGCLPDGAAAMTFVSSGGLVLDIMRGNEITCSSNVAGSQVSVTDKAGSILSGHAALETNVVFDDLPRGRTGTLAVLVKVTLVAGAIPPVWTSSAGQCTADVTTNAFVETEDGGALHEVGGAITCTGTLAPAPDNSQAPLTISTFSFVTAVLYP